MAARHVQTMELITGDKGNPRTPSVHLDGGSMLAGLEIDYHPCAIGGICAVFPHSSLHLSPIILFLLLDPQ